MGYFVNLAIYLLEYLFSISVQRFQIIENQELWRKANMNRHASALNHFIEVKMTTYQLTLNFRSLCLEQEWANSALRCICCSRLLSRAHVVDTLSLVTFNGDYAILALRNYKMQAERYYSFLTIVKLLTPFMSMKHSRDSLDMQFAVYIKAVTATLLHSMYFR